EGPDGKPGFLQNLEYRGADRGLGFNLYRSTHHYRGHGLDYSFQNANGFTQAIEAGSALRQAQPDGRCGKIMVLADRIRQARARHPNKPALIVGDRRWTYEQFDEITDRIAAALLRRGIRRGDRVALHFANGSEIVFGYAACFKIGAVAVPVNIRMKGPEIE